MWIVVTEYWNGYSCGCCQRRDEHVKEFSTEEEAMAEARQYPLDFSSKNTDEILKGVYKGEKVYPK